MKRIFLSLVMIMAIVATVARDHLFINNFSIDAGQTKTIDVLLTNDTTYCAMQTDIVLSNGLSIELDGDEYIVDQTLRSSNHAVSTSMLSDGAVRVILSVQNTRPFTGSNGAIIRFSLKAASSFVKGDITLRNNILIEMDGTRHVLANSTAKVNDSTSGGLRGDVDGSAMVDVDDVNAMINLILNFDRYKDQYPGSADLDGNGMVDVDDVNALINIILSK